MTTTDKHVFFYGGFLSNFAESIFDYTDFGETHEFFCSEQCFMWCKAKFFGDNETAEKILAEKSDPMVVKMLGREVKNYDDEKWDSVRFRYMFNAVYAKMSQNIPMKEALCNPKYDGKTFVEASPYDAIWGIKLGMKTPLDVLDDERNWRGKNLLGQVINKVREKLIEV